MQQESVSEIGIHNVQLTLPATNWEERARMSEQGI